MYGHSCPLYAESTCTILICTFEEFQEKYNDANLDTNVLCDDLLRNTIWSTGKYHDELAAASDQYHLDKLLEGMLNYAPTPAGRRYVAIALHIAHHKGGDAVVNVAQAWLHHLFLMMRTLSKLSHKVESSGSQTPTIDDTIIQIEKASRVDQPDLRDKLCVRESFRCAITRSFDTKRAEELIDQGKSNEIPPDTPQRRMEAAHIIPFLLNNFKDSTLLDSARTWDMLRTLSFGRFAFYFDKDAFPDNLNKYKVRMSRHGRLLSNGRAEADVEFPTLQASGIDPPDPEFLRIHAAFTKVLHLSGAADVMDRLERETESGIPLHMHPTYDFAQDISRRLAVLAM
ncbi:hypothetical protein BDZ89DRAFT_1065773 [Hymenopellis radicata]|nr:hypothetical protein BDZ89DRAFT_1065773 [Hymenopellis radicata]